jgi:hypothetical protein
MNCVACRASGAEGEGDGVVRLSAHAVEPVSGAPLRMGHGENPDLRRELDEHEREREPWQRCAPDVEIVRHVEKSRNRPRASASGWQGPFHVGDESCCQTGLARLEDLHWLDDASDRFVAELVEIAPATRSLVVLNFRPEYAAEWTQRTASSRAAVSSSSCGARERTLDLPARAATPSCAP